MLDKMSMNECGGSKTQELKRLLQKYILEKHLRYGDKLPSQQELRSRLGISGTTVIRAINALASEGMLEIRNKQGVFLATDRPPFSR